MCPPVVSGLQATQTVPAICRATRSLMMHHRCVMGGGGFFSNNCHEEEFIPSLLSWIHTTPSVTNGAVQRAPGTTSLHGSVPCSEAATHPSPLNPTGIPTPCTPLSRGIPPKDVSPPPPPRPSARAHRHQNTATHRRAHAIAFAQSSHHHYARNSNR
jgi:hypothetical protein